MATTHVFWATLLLSGCAHRSKDAQCLDADDDGFYADTGCVDTAAGFLDEADCNDSNAHINPVEPDVVDAHGTDQNCDGADGVDQDGDACPSVGSGGDDCDDAEPARWGANCAVEDCTDAAVNLCDTTEVDAMRVCGWGADASLADADARLEGESRGDTAGFSLAWAGDMNGDGVDDLAVGARFWPAGTPDGRVYLIAGGASRLTDGQLIDVASALVDGAPGTAFGHALAAPGDTDGDGIDDLLVSASSYNDSDGSIAANGATYVIPGSSDLGAGLDDALMVRGVLGATCRAGYSLSPAGDVDADGRADVLLGAPEGTADPCVEQGMEGAAWLILGSELVECPASEGGCTLGAHPLAGEDASDFGMGLAAGDLDGDGERDLLIGASDSDEGAGEIYVVPASTVLDGVSTLTSAERLYAGQRGSSLGGRLVSGVDLDRDGYDDVVSSADALDADQATQGAVLILYGSPLAVVAEVTTLLGEGSKTGPGTAISILDDADGDARPDLAVGAPCVGEDLTTEGKECQGATYVVFGSDISPGTAYLSSFTRFLGESSPDHAGFSVSGQGDGDGDGYSDLLIGAHAFDAADDKGRGAAYLIYGGGY